MIRNPNLAQNNPRRTPLGTAGFWMATALPLLAPVLLAVVTVRLVSLSPTDVSSGGTSTGTVTLDPTSTVPVTVFLFSSNPSLARVPDKISVTSKTRTGTFPITTVSGGGGCSTISAEQNGTGVRRSELLLVRPPSTPAGAPVSVSVPTVVTGSASASGSVLVISPQGAPGPVQLTSSNPEVTVPPSVTPAFAQEIPGAYRGTFNITTVAVGPPGTCAIITATLGSSRSRAVLKVVTMGG